MYVDRSDFARERDQFRCRDDLLTAFLEVSALGRFLLLLAATQICGTRTQTVSCWAGLADAPPRWLHDLELLCLL